MPVITNRVATNCSEVEIEKNEIVLRRSQRLLKKTNNSENIVEQNCNESSSQMQTDVFEDRCDAVRNPNKNPIAVLEVVSNVETLSQPFIPKELHPISVHTEKNKHVGTCKTIRKKSKAAPSKVANGEQSTVLNEKFIMQQVHSSGNKISVPESNGTEQDIKHAELTKQYSLQCLSKEVKPNKVTRKRKSLPNKQKTILAPDDFHLGHESPLKLSVTVAPTPEQKIDYNQIYKQVSERDITNSGPKRRQCQQKRTYKSDVKQSQIVQNSSNEKKRSNAINDFLEQSNYASTTAEAFRMKQYIERGQVRIYPQNEQLTESILPHVYPPHFVNQHKEMPLIKEDYEIKGFHEAVFPTPDVSCELETSSRSTPSLPDSLRGVFDSDDIREILNIDKVAYRLTEKHVQLLAVVLNIKFEYLREVLERLVQVNVKFLHNVDMLLNALPEIREKYYAKNICTSDTDDASSETTSIIGTSQSPVKRILISQTSFQ